MLVDERYFAVDYNYLVEFIDIFFQSFQKN